ncbi:hypothetical protein ACFRI7_22565 [Streptomyces sp. NPDC056716]|uniref:hypothetical protein n=1 Tax=unclassified Streptomyces TaxID=2593676 RepID=UPI003693AE76
MSIYDDIAAIMHPPPKLGEVPEDVHLDAVDDTHAARAELARSLENSSNSDSKAGDPLLWLLRTAHYRRQKAEREIRHLVAYAREFTRPGLYTPSDLAGAFGTSVSGVSTVYGPDDVAAVEQATGGTPHEGRAADRGRPAEAESGA